MFRVCKQCGKFKEESDFPMHSKGKLRAICKECYNRNQTFSRDNKKNNERNKLYYQSHKSEIIERTKEWGKNNREKRRKAVRDMRERRRMEIQEYKTSVGCLICGEKDPACLDFHHLNSSEKENNIAELVLSRKRMEEEIKKCVVLCSNCHRKLHFYGEEHFPEILNVKKNKTKSTV